jgi:excisionase family DNA binding protein
VSGNATDAPEKENKMTGKLAYTISEAVAASGLGRTTIYELIKRGELPIAKVGSKTLIRCQDLADLLERKLVHGHHEHPEPSQTA